MDILFFGGQSNMEGQTEAVPSDTAPVPGCLEYKLLSRSYVPLAHPAGEDVPPHLGGPYLGRGSLLPDFCRAYRRCRPVTVAAVHAALGATDIDAWAPASPLYEAAVGKFRAAVEDAPEPVEHIYYIWLQGESDALRRRTADEYFERLVRFKNALRADCGIERFGIIRVGYFAAPADDEAIMEAQERAAAEDGDFLLLTRLAALLSRDADFLNPEFAGHFNNRAMTWLGQSAGESLGRFAARESRA